MGGKHKQAQRTKNNARPSSSGRSAELLGNSAPTFMGFTAVNDGGFVPVFPGLSVKSEEFDSNLNSDFHLVLKKMGKKDSTTKLKALQEFSELVTNSELEVVKTVLPFWPRLYCQLAVDVEHRVREAAHQALRALVLRVKRNLAPYLRHLAGPWFTSQYDTYPPAASAAALAFQDAFPPKKAIEAIIFCQEEILKYICDNLMVQTAQTLSNPKVVAPEEMEAKYQRIVVSSLQGYVLYLHKLPAEQLQAAHEANKKLIASKKFWNLSKHTSALIRNAWFSVLIALCQKAPDLLADEGARAALAVFGSLDETDPAVLPTVWEASLHVLNAVQDCWQHVNAEKLVLPKLWRILREGGQGNAATIFPNLLPFLCKISSSVCSNKQDFYDKFFNNMRHGFSQKLVLQSASECSAVARCYIECLRYTVMLHLSDSNFCQALVQNHLIATVVLMLKDQKFKLVSAALFSELSVLVDHWSNSEGYAVLVQLFWDQLTSVILESLSPTEESYQSRRTCAEWLLNIHLELCLCLKNPKHKRSRQGLKVKFISPENNSENESPETESCSETALSTSNDFHTDKCLQTLVQDLSVSYLTKTEQYSDPTFLVYLEKLVRAFESRELFLSLLKVTVGEDIQTESNELLVQLYDATLQKWLQDEKLCSESVVRITFALLKFLTANGKNHILEGLCKVSKTAVLVWCVSSALEHQSDPCVQDWLHSAQLSQILLSLAHDICFNKTDMETKHILECCFDKIRGGEMVISPAAVSDILSEFSRLLLTSDDEPICMDFVMEVVMSLYSSDLRFCPFLHSNVAAEDLLLSLFRLSCQNNTSIKDKIDAAWQVGISALARLHGSCSETFLNLTLKFAEVVKEELLTREDAFIVPIDHIVATVVSFLRTSARCLPIDICDLESSLSTVVKLCSVFLDYLSSEFAAKEQKLTAVCLYAEKLKGLLNRITRHSHTKYLFNTNPQSTGKSCSANCEDTVGSEKEIVQYVILLLFSVTLISKLPESLNLFDKDEIKDGITEEDIKQEMSSSDIHLLEDHILTAIYSVALCKSFIRHFKSSVYYYKVFFKNDILDERFKMLLNVIDAKGMDYITCITARRALQYGSLWVKALHLLHTQVLTQSDPHELYSDLASDADSQTIHISEIFASCLKVKDMRADETTLNEDKLIMLTSWLNQLEGPVPVDCHIPVVSFLNSVFAWYKQDDKAELLFDCEVKWPQVKGVIAVARFLAAVVEKCPQLLTSHLWDATIVSLASWMLTLKNSRNLLLLPPEGGILPLVPKTLSVEVKQGNNVPSDSKKKLSRVCESSRMVESFCLDSNNNNNAAFAVAVFQLYKVLTDFLAGHPNDLDHAVQISLENMIMEWTDVFADDVHKAVVSVFYTVIGLVQDNSVSLLDVPFLESLGDVILRIDPKYFVPSESTDYNSVIKCFCELLHSPVIPLQLTAYHTLTRLVQGLIDLDTCLSTKHERFGVSLFQDSLQETQMVVENLLLDISLGNSCTVCPFTDAYYYTTAYLLLWDVVFQMCGLASSELRSQYATHIRKLGFLNSLLQNVFRLMPEQVLQTKDPKFKLQKTSEMFSSAPSLVFSQTCSSEMLEHMSCWAYCNALRRLPALVCHWWGDLEPKVATLVDQVTTVHCAPLLCAEEMKVIQAKDMHHGNMLIKVHPSVREVVAIYKVEEAEMEISLQLPNNYPLSPVRIESRKQLVDSGQWHNKMMQLSFFLTHQHSSIWDGLERWKSNLDKRFEGVEECNICFSVVQSSNLEIPRQSCSKCKKKFHSTCLVKWINTSNKATCPICRNVF